MVGIGSDRGEEYKVMVCVHVCGLDRLGPTGPGPAMSVGEDGTADGREQDDGSRCLVFWVRPEKGASHRTDISSHRRLTWELSTRQAFPPIAV